MKKSVKRITCGILSLMMASTLVVEHTLRTGAEVSAAAAKTTQTATTDSDVSFKNVTGKYDTSKIMQENFNSSVKEVSKPVYETRTVIVTLDGKPVAERAKGEAVKEYLSTWDGNRAQAAIQAEQAAFLRQLAKNGISYKVEGRYDTVLNGIAIEIDTKYVSTIKKMDGVDGVFITTSYSEPETATATSNGGVIYNETDVYATGIYDSSEYASMYGEGTVVAVLDTGLDYTHNAFQSFKNKDAKVAWNEQYVKDVLNNPDFDLSAEVRSGELSSADVYLSAKVPFAYDYADDDPDVYPSYSNHGTHVAGIIGGYDPSGYTDKDGIPQSEEFIGVAPDAQLMICKVFTDDLDDPDLGGAVAEDIIAALDDCVKLGVDVINMSLGTSCGFTTTNDGDDEGEMLNEVYQRIQASGISLICAASNDYSAGYGGVYGTNLASNPDSSTVGSPSTFAAALSVASINGQQAPYLVANAGATEEKTVFFEQSRDIDGNPYDFVADLAAKYNGQTEFEYVVVGGKGLGSDYYNVEKLFKDSNGNSLNRIALVSRGESTFQDKVEVAMKMGAIGIIIYNNVSGTIRMNLGEIDDPIPAISINNNAGLAMVEGAGRDKLGTITLSSSYTAGPFMSEFSSWGPTHDLKIKPEITAHGGEITSAVPGGYGEQSGTSMATPNMAGFIALVRNYVKNDLGITNGIELNRRVMQLTMSTAGLVYDQDGYLYSPRKQGAGVAKLENVIAKKDGDGNVIKGTQAYLYTDNADCDYRPKLELGDDPDEMGVYNMRFFVKNFSDREDLTFTLKHAAMTESTSKDKITVAEQAHMLDKATAVWTIDGKTYEDGDEITVKQGESLEISVTLSLHQSEINYIKDRFENGMYVEGFLSLLSSDDVQCDLNIPFLAFFGDWNQAPMLDVSAFEVAESAQDASVEDDQKLKASVWETLPYNSYYNEKYILPMGGYVYLLPEDADPMYVDEDKCSVSRYNEYYGEGNDENYLSSTSIKALYAGLLRNAKLVKYKLYNVATGELIMEDKIYRVGKAYAGGGAAVPANVELELFPELEGLVANGLYRLEFDFFQEKPEDEDGAEAREEDSFEFTFTVDYEAPVLEDARVRYYSYKDGDKWKQRIYLDVDVFDNHYAQAVLLCYPTYDKNNEITLQLATDYPAPVRNANKNGTTTVSIEITDIYEKYGDKLYLQIDDYAVNSCLYELDIHMANVGVMPDDFSIANGDNITLDIYQTHKVELDFGANYTGSADESNFTWKVVGNPDCAQVKNGEIVGLKAGSERITVTNHKGVTKTINVTVTDKETYLSELPTSISFGIIENYLMALEKAKGTVEVYAGKEIPLTVEKEPWFHPMENLRIAWKSNNEAVATVDENGVVHTLKKGSAVISATVEEYVNGVWKETRVYTSVTLKVLNEFTVSNYTLTKYNGIGWNEEIDVDGDGTKEKVLRIPTDMNIWYIGTEAFKENDNVEIIIIPSSVIDINENAFLDATALREVYFTSVEHRVGEHGENYNIDFSDLKMIYEYAFKGCTALEKVDFSNVKTVTIAQEAFANCTSLTQVVDMKKIGTMHHRAFANTALTGEVDLSGLHMSGQYVFEGCNNITSVKTGRFTAIGDYMFAGCTSLSGVITLHTPKIGTGAFRNCTNLSGVVLDSNGVEGLRFDIGASAFENCGRSADGFTVDFGGETVRFIGDRAFANTQLSAIDFSTLKGLEVLGSNVFAGTSITQIVLDDGIDFDDLQLNGAPFSGLTVTVASGSQNYKEENGVIYTADGKKLLYANATVAENFTLPDSVNEIFAYAFANNTSVKKVVLHDGVHTIGKYAFSGSALTEIVFGNGLGSIAEGAFRNSALTEAKLPSSVLEIGDYAFTNTPIKSFTGDGVVTIGNNAFANCRSLVTLVLSETVTTLGNSVFENCSALTSAVLPSVKTMGWNVFYNTGVLNEVTFGENAATIGTYTFYRSAVAKVTFTGTAIETIGEGTFSDCNNITSVVLPESVKEIGAYAFYGCRNLSEINLENVQIFGDMSFYNTALTALDLDSAKEIGTMAFGTQVERTGDRGEGLYTSVSMPVVEQIGNYAFLNGAMSSIALPETVKEIGYGVFGSAGSLVSITVAENNANFFVENNVLYRYIDKAAGLYELTAYPSALVGEGELGARTYKIKDGTTSVLAYAFYGLNAKALNKVVLPYSVKLIGDSAFFASGVTEYTFESIDAPTLESVYRQEISDQIKSNTSRPYYRGYYYANFETYLFNFTDYVKETSTLKINYPSNGKGYDSYIYRLYFGTKLQTGIAMEDDTRECINLIEAMYDGETILSWTQAGSGMNQETLREFSETVKTARLHYNNVMKNADQKTYITEEHVEKLAEVEGALREVKVHFGIESVAKEIEVAPSSTHKTAYTAGERFDKTGLRAIVTYDDYSTEEIDASDLDLLPRYDVELTVYNRYVQLEYGDLTLTVDVQVAAKEENKDPEPVNPDPDKGGSSSEEKEGGCGSVVSVIAPTILMVSMAFLLRKKKED
ncbi:MAG: hypothetical protein E7380_00965 [Clostridiales bacterium]|nr:hypothetical protein [Clostridiales bacterium]